MKSHYDAVTVVVRTMGSAALTKCDIKSVINELFQRLNNILQEDCNEEAAFELLCRNLDHWKSVNKIT